jgi:hypothetical protein
MGDHKIEYIGANARDLNDSRKTRSQKHCGRVNLMAQY